MTGGHYKPRDEPLRHDGSCVNCGKVGSHAVTCWWWLRYGHLRTTNTTTEAES